MIYREYTDNTRSLNELSHLLSSLLCGKGVSSVRSPVSLFMLSFSFHRTQYSLKFSCIIWLRSNHQSFKHLLHYKLDLIHPVHSKVILLQSSLCCRKVSFFFILHYVHIFISCVNSLSFLGSKGCCIQYSSSFCIGLSSLLSLKNFGY